MKWADFEEKNNTFLNPYSYLIFRKNSEKEKFNIMYDGISLSLIYSFLSHNKHNCKRMSFDDTSLAPYVFNTASKKNKTVGIIGSKEEVIQKTKLLLEKKYPHLIISECFSGYFSTEEKSKIIERLGLCDIVICGMGTPKQEEILIEIRSTGWRGTGFTCGGYFDQLCQSNGNSYYPTAIDMLNLRWAYRIYKEPKRLWKRYLVDYPQGIFFFVLDKIKNNF